MAATIPTFAFMRVKLSRWIALGFGSGLAPVMPGTVGTLCAWVLFLILDQAVQSLATASVSKDLIWLGILTTGLWLGSWACDRTGRDLGVADHGAMVWDEFIAFWLVLWVLDASTMSFSSQFWAFIAFRFFDMVKPPPIRYFDQRLKSGFGVMFDDLLAAFYTLLLIAWFNS